MERLNNQDEQIMLHAWQLKEFIVKDILRLLPEPRPPYTTLASSVKVLESRGFLTSQKYGNVYIYKPKISETVYKEMFMTGFVKNYFENSYTELVTFFAREQKISSKDLEEIIKMIEKEK